MFSESSVDKAMEWVAENDLTDETMTRYSRLYDYVFLDEDIVYGDEERDYVFFLWSVIIHLFDHRIDGDLEVNDEGLENEERELWKKLEEEATKVSSIDLLYDHCKEKELFAFLEDGLESNEGDPENIISSKEMSMLLLVKMTSAINYLTEIQ